MNVVLSLWYVRTQKHAINNRLTALTEILHAKMIILSSLLLLLFISFSEVMQFIWYFRHASTLNLSSQIRNYGCCMWMRPKSYVSRMKANIHRKRRIEISQTDFQRKILETKIKCWLKDSSQHNRCGTFIQHF